MSRRTTYLAQGAWEQKLAGAFRTLYEKLLAENMTSGEAPAVEAPPTEEELAAVQALRAAKERSKAPEKTPPSPPGPLTNSGLVEPRIDSHDSPPRVVVAPGDIVTTDAG